MTAFRVALALIVVAILMAMSSGAAQPQAPRTQIDIQRQIQRSAELQRQALRSLTDSGRTEQLIDNAYAELRAALSAMVINASDMKFPDPLLDIKRKRGEQALSLLQAAGDVLKRNRQNQSVRPGPEDQEEDGRPGGSRSYVELVRNNLEQALRLTSTLAF
ncbi:MAG TPA: hypothetical protein VGK54_06535 [Chloroflexota bacterium]|jgi:hypothetical protein